MLDFDQVARTFAAAADTYRRAAVVPREIETRLLERLDYIRCEVRTALDLGSGPGRGAAELARRLAPARVVALDLALPLLRLGASSRPRSVSRVCGDAGALPFADRSFELVFSNLALPWCADPGLVLTEVRRVLKAGGAFLFTTLGPDTLAELRASWSACDDLPHVHPFIDMHLIGDALLECGFADPVMDMELLTFTYRGVDCLLRDLKGLGGHNLARDRRRGLTGKHRFQAMRRAYEARRVDGRIPASFEVVYGLAWGPPDGQPRRRGDTDVATFPVDHLRRRR